MRNDMATILPPELKHHIAHFCKPAELAILALVHKSYRDEAEPLLYKEVVVYLGSETVPKVLDTLKTRPHKAIMVQSMKIEFARRWRSHGTAASASALDLLCAAFGKYACTFGPATALASRGHYFPESCVNYLVSSALQSAHTSLQSIFRSSRRSRCRIKITPNFGHMQRWRQ
ncbi:hypothetical protein BDP27DRAFT_1318047 [Rhodocollybia butyracea]|uniref:F-box domain-containing protein n=1 Tax=Rhodocollybia butyracea TaxID=206335 RepID=A0A9P5UD11_9AGAR|nr:hypothetical protein BDP27DRAFT_1318047 [Rhodocollybia butyracea]